MFSCGFSWVNTFTGNVAAPVFKCVLQTGTLPALSNTAGLVFGTDGTIVLCSRHSYELYIMYMILHINCLLFALMVFNVGNDLFFLPSHNVWFIMWIFHVSVYQERKMMIDGVNVFKLGNKRIHQNTVYGCNYYLNQESTGVVLSMSAWGEWRAP